MPTVTGRRFHIRLGKLKRLAPFPFRLDTVGRSFMNPEVKSLYAVYPDQFEICLRLNSEHSGDTCRQLLNGKWYENLTFPQVVLKLPGTEYRLENFFRRDVFYFIYPSSLLEKFRTSGLLDGPLCWEFPFTQEVELFLHRIHTCMTNCLVPGNADKLDLYCYQLLCELLQYRIQNVKMPDKEQELMQKIDSFLLLHAFEEVDFEEVAARFGLSRSTFFRYWKRYCNVSPSRYLQDLRLQEMCRRLKESRARIDEIARDLSLGDPSYVSMLFRKKYKMPPLAYRKKYSVKKL